MRPVTENARYGATQEPVGSRALAGRLVGRERGRRRLGDGRARRRQRPRRVDPHPGVVLRPRRPEAEPGPGLDRPGLRRRGGGHAGRLRAHPDRAWIPPSRSTRSPATSRATATTPRLRRRRSPTPRAGARAAPGAAVPGGAVRDADRRGAGRGGARGRRRAGVARPRGRRGTPAWDDESFGSSWATFMGGTCQHWCACIERLHGRPVDPSQLEPATRAWLLDAPPMPLVDYLEAAERLWAFGRRIQAGWAPNEMLLTPTLTRLPAAVGGISRRPASPTTPAASAPSCGSGT